MGQVISRSLLKAAYAATVKIAERRPMLIPTLLIGSGQPLLRSVKRQYCAGLAPSGSSPDFRETADNARTIRDEHSDGNRWSGTGHGAAPDQGGLYLSLTSGAASAEVSHYYGGSLPRDTHGLPEVHAAFLPPSQFARQREPLVLFRMYPTGGLLLVDLSGHAPHAALFEELDRDADVTRELRAIGASGTLPASRSASDYSCSRGIALGLAQARSPGYDGILVRTARDNREIGDDGDNLVLFGRNGVPHPKLRVDCALVPQERDSGLRGISLSRVGY